MYIHTYVYIYIYIYILKRLPPLPPTSTQTRGFHDETIPVDRFGNTSSHILEAFDHLWCLLRGHGAIWTPVEWPGYPNELYSTPMQAGAPIY